MRHRFLLRALAAGAALCAAQAALAQAEQTMTRVEITGTSIRRLAAQSSLPLTTIRADDFAKQGLTTAQEVLNTIPMNQTSVSGSQSVGAGTGGRSEADLRGLGSNKTLVLLNGRRLANHPYGADTVDLNVIPVAALERVEVLRDGASAIYGTDAIGGVVNFITRRSVKGGAVTLEGVKPQASGGGDEARLNLLAGFGELDTDRFNVFGVVDVHHQAALPATARAFSATGLRPERGVLQTSGTPFPANFYSANDISGNPAFASGCLPPASVPSTSNRTCRFDYTRFVDDIPEAWQETWLGKASYKLSETDTASLELLHSRSTNETHVAPPPLAGIGLTMTAASPYYPGRGITPAVPGLTGEDLDVSWRPLVTGQRRDFSTSLTDRILGSVVGSMGGWDYNAGLSYAESRARSAFRGGYVIDQRMVSGVASGLLNPFGEQSPAGLAYLNDSLLLGEYLNAKMRSTALDAHASRELGTLAGGALALALGAEFRHDRATYRVNRDLASQASSSGYADAKDQEGSRNIGAVFFEIDAPFLAMLEANLAVRYDRYNDVGGSTNPKLSLKWQPTRQLLGRASYNTGFRAPTLYDLHAPQVSTNTSDVYNDPRLCPNGVAVPGANPNLACDQQQTIRGGGNPNVKPEKSRTYSAGVVIEPMPTLTLSLDYWNIRLKDQINSLAEQTIFGDPLKYASLFHYNAAGNRLDYIEATTTNLGEVRARGLDLSLTMRLPYSLALQADGTYVDRYAYQNERGGPYTENAGVYADASPVFRWRHNLLLSWLHGPWSVNVGNRYMSGYHDQNAVAPAFRQNVGAYSTWSLAGSYTGFQRLNLTVGVKNLFDKDPPYTNQHTTFQQGYDPRYTDPLGRTFYARGTVKF
ncbi:TonB-dependent receptor [Massilia sp. TS11]|uniref:TonB-dependent receptor n=1 Tax=Massilia sp. TS11 TaxID=2908003 RepID=UPI001EDBF1C4|nr:TonB-dependent receptor [Massilia sp. TS11]MCG2585900.1 TonB-dependent receptor [Massilia sp. TS11]